MLTRYALGAMVSLVAMKRRHERESVMYDICIATMINALFTFPNMAQKIAHDGECITVTFNNLIVKVDRRAHDLFYMQIKINGIRVLTTINNAETTVKIIDDLLDSCDMIEA